ncbi:MULTISPECIES: hypothetical protein [unclassified Brevibacterium]|nr:MULTISPECIES: hypothetical protein [unclassified Brevibacterium]
MASKLRPRTVTERIQALRVEPIGGDGVERSSTRSAETYVN